MTKRKRLSDDQSSSNSAHTIAPPGNERFYSFIVDDLIEDKAGTMEETDRSRNINQRLSDAIVEGKKGYAFAPFSLG